MKKKFLALMMAISMAIPSVAFAGEQTTAKDELTIRIASDNGTIDYHNSTADNVTRLRSLICNSLMEAQRNDEGKIEFVLGDESLATDYVMDEDNMGITFTIREGVKFQNGYDMTTDDVAFSIRLYEGLTGFEFIDYANITTTDTTVHVPFVSPNAGVFYFLGVMIPVYSEQYYNEMGGADAIAEFYSTKAIGTGAYALSDWVQGDYIELTANEDYFAGTPVIKTVRFRLISEASVALMELETGGIDMVIDPATTDVQDVLDGVYDGSGIAYWADEGTQQYVIGYNCAGPLSDIQLRQAIAYAIDMDAINQTVYGVGAGTASSIVSLTAEGIVDLAGNWPYPYDPEKAIELRDAAGYTEGELSLTYLVGGGDAQRTAVGEMMANYLAQVGINMEIVNVDKSAWASMIQESSGWDVHLRGITAVATTYMDYFNNLLPTTAHYGDDPASADFTAAFEAIAGEIDEETRLGLWKSFQEAYLTDYAYSLPLSQVNDYTLVSDKLQGAEKVSLFRLNLKDAYFTE